MTDADDQPNRRVLVVDDNQAIHEDFRKILVGRPGADRQLAEAEAALFGETPAAAASVGFEVDAVLQGQEALDRVRQSLQAGRPYAMAFVDGRMPPGWDGIETTARLWEVHPDLQVVICTAYSDYSWDEVFAKLGQSDRLVILKKPFDNVEVWQLAHALTEKWRLHQRAKAREVELRQQLAQSSAALRRIEQKYRTIFDYSVEGMFQTTPQGRYLSANPALARIYGYDSVDELVAKVTDIATQLYVDPQRRAEFVRLMQEHGRVEGFESEVYCRDGSKKWISENAIAVRGPDGQVAYYQGSVLDITASKEAERERKRMEVQLRQAQKLESIGQLAAGIAHEINTPTQFIGDNTRFLQEAFRDLDKLLIAQDHLLEAARQAVRTLDGPPQGQADPSGRSGAFPTAASASAALTAAVQAVEQAARAADLDYLREEIPRAIEQTLHGVERVTKIVRAMKDFSHPGATSKVAVDLHQAIQSTITVATNEWKYLANVVTDFDTSLPPVPVLPGEFNQVILNLLINAAHAIGDVVGDGTRGKGTITIRTRRDGDWAEVQVQDTGAGIPEKIRDRIFDPFFTTKPVGKGTGQGLAIAHAVIVDKHGGSIGFETEVGQGTTFHIRLPLAPESGGSDGPKAGEPAGRSTK
jgi:PAS domain S-box-containing protein